MAPNTGNFACIEHMRFRVKKSSVKTVSGSVATYATTQQLTDETVDRICVLVYDIIGEVQSYHFRSRRTSGGL
jgi:hypothetical protein